MRSMDYYQPTDLQEALHILAGNGPRSVVMAGGTDVMVALNDGVLDKDGLVNLAGLVELQQLQEMPDSLRLGPLLTMAEIARSRVLMEKTTCLSEAALQAASPHVRNLGTIGGNLGTGSPAGDFLPPLMALNARITVSSKNGEKELSLKQFLLGPKKTALMDNEMITAITVPFLLPGSGSSFIKLGKRKALSISIASVAAVVTLSTDGKQFADVRVALGSLAPTVVRSDQVEAALKGRPADEKEIEKAAALVRDEINPITDGRATAWYRLEVAGPLVKKALVGALAHASKM